VVGASTSGWGNADVGGTWLHRFNGGADAATSASADGARGRMTVTATNGLKFLVSSVGPTVADADVKVTARADRSTGTYLMLVARVVDTNHFYAAQLNLAFNSFTIRRNGPIPNVWTTLGSGPTPATPFAADTDYTIRLQVEGTALRAKWWLAGQPEPSAWAVQVTDTSYASGQSGVAGVVTTYPATVNFTFDDFVAAPLGGGVSGQGGAPSKPSGASSPITGASDPMTGISSTETTASAPTSTATPSPTSTATPSPTPTPTGSAPATGGDDWRRRLADLLRLLRLGG